MSPSIGITMGDPLGIGPEIILKSIGKFRSQASFQVFGDPDLLADLPKDELRAVTSKRGSSRWTALEAGGASVAYLEGAMAAYQAGEIQALVTAPISKEHVQQAGFPFPGHTEYLGHKTGTKNFTMMMAGPRLRVTLVTIHTPLSQVSAQLSVEKIVETIQLSYQSLKEQFALAGPRLAVCGLNPHAGEAGLLGREEIEIIKPAIEAANEKGYACHGPQVPDAVFHEAYEGKWDGVVCMYHDQGLIPFKMIHFNEGVNLTLGLPLVRTSPDHGTAFDIAGKGMADSSSMEAAIDLAIKLVKQQNGKTR